MGKAGKEKDRESTSLGCWRLPGKPRAGHSPLVPTMVDPDFFISPNGDFGLHILSSVSSDVCFATGKNVMAL